MPKYLFTGSYTQEGINGLIAGGGGTTRKDAVSELVSSLGGTLETFYYAFGSSDIVLIAELPDDASATAVSLTVGASGAFQGQTTVLIEPSAVDDAVGKTPRYRQPGS